MDSDIARENTIVRFFNPSNGLRVYEDLCGAYFPRMLQENYTTDGYFETFAAQAFVGKSKYGVLIREDLDFDNMTWYQVFYHELSHLFCTENEIDGGGFYDRYCMGSGVQDGMINAGYAIWREAIADIMADSIMSEYAAFDLRSVRNEVTRLYDDLSVGNPASKKQISLIIGCVMLAHEVAGTTEWAQAEQAIRSKLHIRDEQLIKILRMVFDNLHDGEYWTITPEFITDLGSAYLMLLTNKMLSILTKG